MNKNLSYRKIDPLNTLARLQSARCALDVCTASVEASVGESIEKLDAERDLLECLGSRRESFVPAEAWIERQRRDGVTVMAGQANAALHRQAAPASPPGGSGSHQDSIWQRCLPLRLRISICDPLTVLLLESDRVEQIVVLNVVKM